MNFERSVRTSTMAICINLFFICFSEVFMSTLDYVHDELLFQTEYFPSKSEHLVSSSSSSG